MTPEDVQAVFVETIAHRLCYQPVYELHRHEISPRLMAGILAAVVRRDPAYHPVDTYP